jgi:hypothetical protein
MSSGPPAFLHPERSIPVKNQPFILPSNKASVTQHLAANGFDIKKAFAELAQTGSVRLSPVVKITYCNRRYHIVDEGSVGGENVVDMADESTRELVPAAHADNDGTYVQRRDAAARELTECEKQERFKDAFLRL